MRRGFPLGGLLAFAVILGACASTPEPEVIGPDGVARPAPKMPAPEVPKAYSDVMTPALTQQAREEFTLFSQPTPADALRAQRQRREGGATPARVAGGRDVPASQEAGRPRASQADAQGTPPARPGNAGEAGPPTAATAAVGGSDMESGMRADAGSAHAPARGTSPERNGTETPRASAAPSPTEPAPPPSSVPPAVVAAGATALPAQSIADGSGQRQPDASRSPGGDPGIPKSPGGELATIDPAPAPSAPATGFGPPLPYGELSASDSGFAALMGSMNGLVTRCDTRRVWRDSASQSFRVAYAVLDDNAQGADVRSIDSRRTGTSASDRRFQDFSGKAAIAPRVDCDYVRNQSGTWTRLATDLRMMARDTAEQYRRGLVTEVRRATGESGQ